MARDTERDHSGPVATARRALLAALDDMSEVLADLKVTADRCRTLAEKGA
ncbi:hypothetical protein [Nonomuraea typhae]|nr:hypothetical protein [Nonomuraea typhae]